MTGSAIALRAKEANVSKKRTVSKERTVAERVALAKSKMAKVLDHFLYVVELHANNGFVVYSPRLVSQIPPSFAANVFNVFQRSMHQIEIVGCAQFGIGQTLIRRVSQPLSN
jgi:hypothetical protein